MSWTLRERRAGKRVERVSGPADLAALALIAGLAATGCFWEDPRVEQLRQLGAQGEAEAQYTLGLLYKEDRDKAFRWLSRATDALDGFVPAEGGDLWVRPDDDEAARWFQKAADQGHRQAQYHLGTLYYGGRGVPQDYFEAYVWFQRAAARLTGEQRDRARERSDEAAQFLSAYQVDEARRLVREWKPSKP